MEFRSPTSSWILCLLLAGRDAAGATNATVSNGAISLTFDTTATSADFGKLLEIKGHGPVAMASTSSIWSAEFVTKESSKPMSLDGSTLSASVCRRAVLADNGLDLIWSSLTLGRSSDLVNVTLSVRLQNSEGVGMAGMRLTFATDSDSVGLWSWRLSFGQFNSISANLENSGFGVLHSPPKGFSGDYVSQTTQFMAAFPSASQSESVYVAAHDPKGENKHFHCDAGAGYSSFHVEATPPGAGTPLNAQPYTVDYGVTLAIFRGDWWDASQIYRRWALPNVPWTRSGPLASRTDVPKWMFNITTWVNSHWQGNDIFNVTGGSPEVVKERMTNIVKRFGIPQGALALHWYEWDTLGYEPGSDYGHCASEVTCGFDTHYPEYFPARVGFNDALSHLQSLGVRVAPYINGRIFDKGTETWTRDNAIAFASKQAAPTLNSTHLSLFDESYGSEAKFAVMCPHTQYWQETIAAVTEELTEGFKTDGVYIDQIAIASPKPCWDPTHNHSLGGGDSWVAGYRKMLEMVRAGSRNKMILTESNAEPFMDGIDLYLTLVANSADFAGQDAIVPAFQAVYGEYASFVGAEFFQEDFNDPDVFAAKIAKQFVFGVQMGWFSLGGRDNQDPPMGIYELLMSSKYDPEIEYLRTLSAAKLEAASWLNFGRALRSLPLLVNQSATPRSISVGGHLRASRDLSIVGLTYEPVMSSAWLSGDGKSMLVILTTVKRHGSAQVTCDLNMGAYAFQAASSRSFSVVQLLGEGRERKLGRYSGDAVKIDVSLMPRSVVLIRIEEEEEQEEEEAHEMVSYV